MQNAILAEAATAGIRLVISVDTGIRAVTEAAEARTLGLDLIVTDHHLPDDASALPDCLAVINPAQPSCPYPNKYLCGAAVASKLAQALLDAAAPLTSDAAAFRTRTRDVLIPSFLKLVAIATIADSVPLTGENRAIAALGLAALANPVQPGLRALMQFAKIPLDRAPTATEVGFRLAPRIMHC
jgi:single-stranded-DNA-specific exonuclease